MTLNPEEGRRLHVLSLLERGRITTAQAADALGITVSSLKARLHRGRVILRKRLERYVETPS